MAKLEFLIVCLYVAAASGNVLFSPGKWFDLTGDANLNEKEHLNKLKNITEHMNTTLNFAKQEGHVVVEEIKELASNMTHEAKAKVQQVLHVIELKVLMLKKQAQAQDVNVDSCAKIMDEIKGTADDIVKTVEKCAKKKVDEAMKLWGELTEIVSKFLQEIAEITVNAEQCIASNTNPTEKVTCFTNAIEEATELLKNTMVQSKMKDIVQNIKNIKSSMIKCSIREMLPKIIQHGVILVEKLAQCIIDKIKQGTTKKPSSSSTTEEPSSSSTTEEPSSSSTTKEPSSSSTTEEPSSSSTTKEPSSSSTTEEPSSSSTTKEPSSSSTTEEPSSSSTTKEPSSSSTTEEPSSSSTTKEPSSSSTTKEPSSSSTTEQPTMTTAKSSSTTPNLCNSYFYRRH